MLKPVRLIAKPPAAGFGSKAYASIFFCLAGLAAAAQKESLTLPVMGLLMGFFLAATGDILLAMGPMLAIGVKSNGVFLLGGAAFVRAHGLNLAVLLHHAAPLNLYLLQIILLLPVIYAILWKTGVFRFKKAGVPVLAYAAILSAMLMAAASAKSLLLLGIVLLYITSDTSLFLANFSSERVQPRAWKAFSFTVMLPYYLAQAGLAVFVLEV